MTNPPTVDHAALRQKAEAATPCAHDDITAHRIRYEHGGGRLFTDRNDAGRALIIDAYDQADRDYYFAMSPDVTIGLLDEISALRAQLQTRTEELSLVMQRILGGDSHE